mgnify:CR=1 FL=1
MLPDVLGPDLKIVFCGTAAGRKSAELGFYYAGNGNKFWKTLFETGLTPRLLMPSEFSELINWGIGLTDMVKDKSGMDNSLMRSDFKNNGLVEKINKYNPDVLHFQSNGHPWFITGYPFLNNMAIVNTIHDHKPHLGDKSSNGSFLSIKLGRIFTDRYIVHSEYSTIFL